MDLYEWLLFRPVGAITDQAVVEAPRRGWAEPMSAEDLPARRQKWGHGLFGGGFIWASSSLRKLQDVVETKLHHRLESG
jgi:hypothetical protein